MSWQAVIMHICKIYLLKENPPIHFNNEMKYQMVFVATANK